MTRRILLGIYPGGTGLPRTVSVPNLMTDRAVLMRRIGSVVDVRRLMYQALIWLPARQLAVFGSTRGDHPRRLAAPLDPQNL